MKYYRYNLFGCICLIFALSVSLAGCASSSDVQGSDDENQSVDTTPSETPTDTVARNPETTPQNDSVSKSETDGDDTSEDSGSFTLKSSAFADGGQIPVKYTCDGSSSSPPLAWSNPPEETQSFAVFMTDPDAPGTTFDHWAVFNIGADRREIPEGLAADSSQFDQGVNEFQKMGYGAPCPLPSDDPHAYEFEIWALDKQSLDLSQRPDFAEVKSAAEPHRISVAELVGTFGRAE